MQLPEEFLQQFADSGVETLKSLDRMLDSDSTACVRINPAKSGGETMKGEPVEWCPEGLYLHDRPAFTFDPALHQGRYYVQDSSSMFISHIIRQLTSDGAPVSYLDACAAPGGKTTAALAALPEGSIVVANEYVGLRAAILRENLAKWGYPGVVALQGDTSRFAADGATFDIIAADVPCSGEGMMRKDPKAVEQWSPRLVEQCADRQREILDNLWQALRPGGYLIYSTCTFNRRENEDMVEYLIDRYGAEPVEITTDPDWGIIPAIGPDLPCYRFVPGAVRGEGQFMAVVRRRGDDAESASSSRRKERRKEKGGKEAAKRHGTKVPQQVLGYASWPDATEFDIDSAGRIRAILPNTVGPAIYRPTLIVGELKGKDIVPSQELALSTILDRSRFNEVELTRKQAIDYLRCQAVTLPEGTPRGFVLATFGGYPLGWLKNIGNRANNLYPKSWRILSEPPAPDNNMAGFGEEEKRS